jgi:hypothetical protein
VPGGAAAGLHLDLERRQVELVVEHRQRVHPELVEPQRLADCPAALVHERRRLEQQHAGPGDPAFLQPALELLLHRPEAVHVGDHVERHEADVVPVHRVLRTGVTEADPELHAEPLKAKRRPR